jgi:hypothetical protein
MWIGFVEVARPVEPGHAYRTAVRKTQEMNSGHVMKVSV